MCYVMLCVPHRCGGSPAGPQAVAVLCAVYRDLGSASFYRSAKKTPLTIWWGQVAGGSGQVARKDFSEAVVSS